MGVTARGEARRGEAWERVVGKMDHTSGPGWDFLGANPISFPRGRDPFGPFGYTKNRDLLVSQPGHSGYSKLERMRTVKPELGFLS